MSKKLIIAVILLVGLVAVLVLVKSDKAEQQPEEIQVSNANTYTLVDLDKDKVEKIIVQINNEKVEYYSADGVWKLADVDNSVLNAGNIDFNVSAFLQLSSTKLIEENCTDLEKYGLLQPVAVMTIVLKDKTEKTLYLGDKTADNNYYYITADNKNIYTIDEKNGKRISCRATDYGDLSMDSLTLESITLVQVVQGDKELYIEYDSDDANANENLKKSGVTTLSMKKPVENLLVYPNNLQTALLYNLKGITLNSMVEIAPSDLAVYGLDKPQITFKLADLENAYIVRVGNEADEDNYYVQLNSKNAVYTMSKSAVEPFMNYKIVDFIQKFLALHTRSEVAEVSADTEYGSFKVDFRAEGENDIKVVDETKKDGRITYINDKVIDRDTFSIFYELLTGLTFDDIKENPEMGEKKATIVYKLMDGTQDVVNFYEYNENFYVAEKGNDTFSQGLLISRQRVKQLVDKASELSK